MPRIGFTGHYFDPETGFYCARARYYDPSAGRFAARDLLLDYSPGGLNAYQYAAGNPMTYWDPFGLMMMNHIFMQIPSNEAVYQQQFGAWATSQTYQFEMNNWAAEQTAQFNASQWNNPWNSYNFTTPQFDMPQFDVPDLNFAEMFDNTMLAKSIGRIMDTMNDAVRRVMEEAVDNGVDQLSVLEAIDEAAQTMSPVESMQVLTVDPGTSSSTTESTGGSETAAQDENEPPPVYRTGNEGRGFNGNYNPFQSTVSIDYLPTGYKQSEIQKWQESIDYAMKENSAYCAGLMGRELAKVGIYLPHTNANTMITNIQNSNEWVELPRVNGELDHARAAELAEAGYIVLIGYFNPDAVGTEDEDNPGHIEAVMPYGYINGQETHGLQESPSLGDVPFVLGWNNSAVKENSRSFSGDLQPREESGGRKVIWEPLNRAMSTEMAQASEYYIYTGSAALPSNGTTPVLPANYPTGFLSDFTGAR